MVRATDDECRGELLARAQRGALSVAEQVALRAHLSSCDSCRVLEQVASDFAGVSAVDRGDAARIEQMSAAARRAAATADGAHRRGRFRMRVSLRAASVAAGVVLLAGTASAAAWLLPLLTRRAAPEPSLAPVPLRAQASARAATREPQAPATAGAPRAQAVAAPTAPAGLPALAPPVVVAINHVAAQPTLDKARARTSAAALLHEARAAATEGRTAAAVVLYRRLQNDFPTSPEALLSAVPLGRLLLERGAPRVALAELDRYLGGTPNGVLVPEALYGRAQALARLGDRAAEIACWRRLVADFPDSPYSAVARRRLSELP